MTPALSDLLARLEELHKAATPRDCPKCHGARPNTDPFWRCEVCAGLNKDPDNLRRAMELWGGSRSALPTLLAIIRVQQEALNMIGEDDCDCSMYHTEEGSRCPSCMATEAQAQVERLVKGDA